MKHILDVSSLPIKTVEMILQTARQFKHFHIPGDLLKGKIVTTMFFEPSTRTHKSFQCATYRLGGNTLDYNHYTSSAKKGETLRDTITTMSQYSDVIVLRHPLEGTVHKCAEVADVPIINAGNGSGEHSTQALLDVFTIQSLIPLEMTRSPPFHIAFVGDLKHGRTVHSTLQLLDKMYTGIFFHFVSNEGLHIDKKYTENLRNNHYCEHNLKNIINMMDIIYMTRIQKERNTNADRSENILTKEILSLAKENAIVLHPLPRNEELPVEIDNDPRCKFVEQMKNGVYVRMAILDYVLSK